MITSFYCHLTLSPWIQFVNLKSTGSASETSLLQSSLSSIASIESKDANSVTGEDDEEDVFSDQTVTYSDDDNQSQILSTPKKVASVSSRVMICFPLPSTVYSQYSYKYTLVQSQTHATTPLRTFHSWEDYHRADTSRTGLIFLWMYLKKIPGREADAAATLAKYYGNDVPVVIEKTMPASEVIAKPTVQIMPDPVGFKSDGNTTDDESNELSRLYQRKYRKKAKKRPTPVQG